MSSKKSGMKSSDLRDNYAQKKYRDQSKAQNKKSKHVAHYFSLDIAAFINQFVKPRVAVNTLKQISNDPLNFRLVDATTNLSNHKQIDNKLMNTFQHIMIEKFNQNKTYKKLLEINPCKLEFEMRKNQINCIILKGVEASRARAQTKKIQKLNFPNHYTAFTRLFYRCFKDSKQREIWNDTGNTTEFRKYLKMQQQKVQSINNNNDDEKEVFIKLDEEKETMNDDHIIDHITDHRTNNKQTMIGKDNKNRILYQGEKGGTYYMTESGRKKYVKSENKSSLSPKHADCNNSERIYGVDDNGRTLYQGTKGGIYYITESGKKMYAKSDKKQKNVENNNNEKEEKKETMNEDKMVGRDNKDRILYEGKKGGTYYITKSGRKTYVKCENKSVVSTEDIHCKHDRIYGVDDNGRTLYQGGKGGIYYISESGKKMYAKSDKNLSASKPNKKINSKCDKKQKNIDDGQGEVVYGTDDKGRTLYQGKKGGLYYKTPSGNKTYVKKR